MIYHTLGKTGLKVSQLGFGAMRLPMEGEGDERRIDRELAMPMIERSLEGGINYYDTAVGYCHQDSQRFLGEALKSRREEVILSTKNPCYSDDDSEWWKNLENSLERLQTDYIDIYNHHGIRWKRYVEDVEPRLSKHMQKAKDQGMIRHICASFHDNNEALMKLVDTGYPDVITLQYNLLDQQLEEGIAHAHENGIGIVVMGPVGGGRLGVTSDVLDQLLDDVKRVPELAMRFVLANPNVDIALSGMSTIDHVEENIRTASDSRSLNEQEKKALADHLERLKKMSDLYCSGCKYCMPCPQEVNIPFIFQVFNQGRVYGLWENAKQRYTGLTKKEQAADKCIECGECLPKCPQNIEIIDELKRAAEALA